MAARDTVMETDCTKKAQPHNPYQSLARAHKAARLAMVLRDYQATPEMVRALDVDGWKSVAHEAGVKPPSGVETVEAVIEFLTA